MADINSVSPTNASGCREPAHHQRGCEGTREDIDAGHIAYVELLFFAYRDFTGEADTLLDAFGFGRAHHRVLHFVHRNPGLKVADLLEILNITKQSLARVLKQLVDDGFIEQRAGAADRRQRLLNVTESGRSLALKLAELQTERIKAALDVAGPEARDAVSRFLLAMVSPGDRSRVIELINELDISCLDDNE